VAGFNLDPNNTNPFAEKYQDHLRGGIPEKLELSGTAGFVPALERSFYYDSLISHGLNVMAVHGLEVRDSLLGRKSLSPKEALDGYGVKIDSDAGLSVVEYMKGRKDKQEQLDKELQLVTEGVVSTAIQFGGSVAGALPETLALSLLMGGTGASAALLNATKAIAASSKLARFSTLGKAFGYLGKDAVGSAIARGAAIEATTTLAETPLRAYSHNLVNEKYGLNEALADVALNATVGGLLHGAGRLIKGAKDIEGGKVPGEVETHPQLEYKPDMSPEIKNVYEAAVFRNKTPEVVPFALLESRLNMPKLQEVDLGNYKFNKIAPEDVHTQGFFAGHTIQHTELSGGSQLRFGEFFGEGVYLTDNIDLAHNSSKSGTVIHSDIDPLARLYDTDLVPDIEVKGRLFDALEKFVDRDEILSLSKSNAKDILDYARITSEVDGNTGAIDSVNQVFKDLGFDGYTFTGSKGGDNFNGLFMFTPDKVKAKVIETARVPRMDTGVKGMNAIDEVKTKLLDFRTNIDYDPDYDIMADLPLENTFEPSFINSRLDKEVKILGEELKELDAITGIGNDLSMDEIVHIASAKVMKGYRGKDELVREVQQALQKEVDTLSDLFGVPKGLVDQRKLINSIKEKILTPERSKNPVEVKFLEELTTQIDEATKLFGVKPEDLNPEEVIKVAKRKVLEDMGIVREYDRAREAAKALTICED